MSTWVWLALAAAFLAIGIAVMLGGLFVVGRALAQQRDAKQLARGVPTPEGAVEREAVPVPARTPTGVAAAPKLGPVPEPAPKKKDEEDEWQDEVPTAVFRPSDYTDIEALMAEADKYVQNHRRSGE